MKVMKKATVVKDGLVKENFRDVTIMVCPEI